jgi:hypothetical protein
MNLKIVTDEAMGKGKGKKSAPQKKANNTVVATEEAKDYDVAAYTP